MRKVFEILDINNRTLRRWISKGRVIAVDVYGRWRVHESKVKQLLG